MALCALFTQGRIVPESVKYHLTVDFVVDARSRMSYTLPRIFYNSPRNLPLHGFRYFAIGDMKAAMRAIESHLMRMLRVLVWKQWKVRKARMRGLIKCGIHPWQAKLIAGVGDKYMKVSNLAPVKKALPKAIFVRAGLVCPYDYYIQRHALKLN